MQNFTGIAKKLFLEDVEKDREYRETAEEIYKKLKSALEKHKTNVLNKVENGYFFDGNNIGFSDFIFYFAPETHSGGYKKWKDYHFIKIPILSDPESSEFLETRLHSRKRTIIHEIIHALDEMRFGISLGDLSSRSDKGSQEYFNSPEELNAYFQEAANEIENFFENLTKYEYKTYKDEFKSFQKFKDWAFDKFFYDEVLENLSNKSRKKYIKRLSKLYKKLKEEGKLSYE